MSLRVVTRSCWSAQTLQAGERQQGSSTGLLNSAPHTVHTSPGGGDILCKYRDIENYHFSTQKAQED